MGNNLILFGFKGSGKTHFGKLLAQKIHRPFIDLDDLICTLYEKKSLKVRQIYQALGEKEFRLLEKKAVHSLQEVQNSIIALGGGTALDPENVEFLEKIGQLVYLKASGEQLSKRIFNEECPAFLEGKDPEKAFIQMVHEREPIYRSIRARSIAIDELDEAGVLAALQSILL